MPQDPVAPSLSIGRLEVIFEAPAPPPAPRPRPQPSRSRGFEKFDRTRLGLRR
ncbi:hypothetical protein [Tropicimonas sp. IMCC34043]|uniref:hypothetical protein n=1 Tax=Tropicimonas sp. IMCC34043 TaxID=2248760 RepID=UPI001300BD3C|nr:hypothetical protein [Tropicimonas sp. IMCC34043]